MKKFILTTILASSIILAGAATASADSATENTKVKNADTDISIEFEKSGSDIIIGPYKKNLTLVHKPSAFNFGKQKVTGNLTTFKLDASNSDKSYLVVNDDREHTSPLKPNDPASIEDPTVPSLNPENVKGGAWVLKAKMDTLTDGTDTVDARLKLDLGTLKHYDIGTKLKPNGDIDPNPANDTSITDSFPNNNKHGIEVKVDDPTGVNRTRTLEAGATAETEIMRKPEKVAEKIGVATEVSNVRLEAGPTAANVGTAAAPKVFKSKVVWTLYAGVN